MSGSARFTAAERRSLTELFGELGPDRPMLCAGWRTRELLVHLVLRESGNVPALAGLAIRRLAGRTEAVEARLRNVGWADLLERFGTGPPSWSPFRLPVLGDAANLVEYYVHHEDVRRAAPDWAPRTLPPAMQDALWRRLRSPFGRLLARKSPVGVRVERPDGAAATVHSGGPTVTLRGAPGELVLYLFGRGTATTVELHGPRDAQAALAQASLGF